MRRAWALSLLLLSAAAVLVWLLVPSVLQRAAHRAPPTTATGQPSRAASTQGATEGPRSDRTSGSFTQRLRCTQARFFYRRVVGPDVLRLLCERRPLSVLKIEAPFAEAGDPHAIDVVAVIANGGQCDQLGASRWSAAGRARVLAVAEQNGATPQTLHRLEELIAEEEKGPTAEEIDACRQASDLLAKLKPGMLQQFIAALDRSLEKLRGENELDINIEYARKMLVHGDAESEENLARLLLDKHTPESQAEALTLLRQASSSSPLAKTELATCLLQGCPTPAPDPTEARQLLRDAAAAGDLSALMTLAGPRDPGWADPDPNLPPPERYAWAQFLRRLHEEGCFGASDYSAWATFQGQRPSLLAMSPADAAAAQARAAELLGEQLAKTRALLGCD